MEGRDRTACTHATAWGSLAYTKEQYISLYPDNIILPYLGLLFFNMSSIGLFVSEKEGFWCRTFRLPMMQLTEKNAG
jgi:hypothetical protein